ncbi:MAG TPA: hypothetical protein VEB20_06145 [Azospirillaceae bacterium]|nr:hypothetical protein [Azospirillaceae bacterium]
MQLHKFKIGESLVYSPGRFDFLKAAGLFEVTRLLPPLGVELQYRVKDVASGQERVVRESQLHQP